jgi:hypothetical protein
MARNRLQMVKVVDVLRAIDLPHSVGDDHRENPIGRFVTLRAAQAGEVLRGVAFAPNEDDADDR